MTETPAWKRFSDMQMQRSRGMLLPRAVNAVQDIVRGIRQAGRVVVTTKDGALRGRYLQYKTGTAGGYYSFQGMRYGKAPIGDRRFKAPLPEVPWKGIRSALREGASCPHRNMILENYKGNEDCLYLNVYTPKLPESFLDEDPKLPVLFWIHGGGFQFGNGNAFFYGPDYLIQEDIILVTINYRLGALGFLNIGTPDAPGNAGLKDQVLALKWVHDNIDVFGGDPNEITIGGQSAGSASVNPQQIVDASSKTLTEEDAKNNVGLAFVPSMEMEMDSLGEHDAAFLTEDPRKILTEGKFNKVPLLIGYNANEAMLFLRRFRKDKTLLDKYENDFNRLIPTDLNVTQGRNSSEANLVADRIRDFYLGGRPISQDTIEEMIFLLTDEMFVRGMTNAVKFHAKFTPNATFVYRFAYDGALGLYKRILNVNRPGICHGDELGYLFYFGIFNVKLDPLSSEIITKQRMVKMWTNFVKYGDPTPLGNGDESLSIKWEPVKTMQPYQIPYLDITNKLEMKRNPETERMEFWDDLYEQYNGDFMYLTEIVKNKIKNS
ncbi:CLUMA_CG020125, isoform A [Clunio marinus]|uniref:Carboxylic ester hydrolase n=1 Tax=Clunio marinus TaxID=568069 RepID=A0A1J1J596_9DIPT|nr:CLUMA_CG020125, isoform A [Clunio marinus]